MALVTATIYHPSPVEAKPAMYVNVHGRGFVVGHPEQDDPWCRTPAYTTRTAGRAPGDGWGIHCWHGTQVPADLIETGWGVDRILAERNTEIRRCAIGRMGWDQFAKAAGLKLVDPAPDPANPGRVSSPYDVPRKVLKLKVRVLVCANATREGGGTRRTFAELEFPVVNPRAGINNREFRSPLATHRWAWRRPKSPCQPRCRGSVGVVTGCSTVAGSVIGSGRG